MSVHHTVIQKSKYVEAIEGIVWYNGYSKDIAEMIQQIKDDEFSAIKWQHNSYLHFIAMMCVLIYGDYGTSPRGGWIHKDDDPEGAIKFLSQLISEEDL